MITKIYSGNLGAGTYVDIIANISKIAINTKIDSNTPPSSNYFAGYINRDSVTIDNAGSFYIKEDKKVKTRIQGILKGVAVMAVTFDKETEGEDLKGYSKLNRINKLFKA